ncbi:alpha/beta fold hydrolase [Altericista sp. CCNU0014]|uniref:alpha/beta fold hydrolase n=1 Tax=Altericista sp. CCNU0014 TaxID=3082949 RepID=UPI00384C2D25
MTVSTPTPTQTHQWQWQGHTIRYQSAGTDGPALVLIHGFGASSDHWRKNLPELGIDHRIYAIDLLGFGLSAKPTPTPDLPYSFETWAQLVLDFSEQVIGEPVVLIGNSIGCIVALQAAAIAPTRVRGVVMLNCSLRMLHERKRAALPWAQRTFSPWFQKILAVRPIGHFFFQRLARPSVIRNILQKAYARTDAVTDELIEYLLRPAQDPGAADVFLAFIQYSHGPLAEDLLPQLDCPVLCLWGAEDPWEPIGLGQAYGKFSAVTDFIALEGVGHCPQDEAPEQVNPLIRQWVARQVTRSI